MPRNDSVPLRRSLLVRLLATSVIIAVCAVAAAVWLTVRTTTQAIRQERVRSLASYAGAYDTLLGYAATHRDWSGAGSTVQALSRSTGQRITLTTTARVPIADSSPGPSLRDQQPSATIDPLRVNGALTGRAEGSIDPRAVGPYRLTTAEKAFLHSIAVRILDCLEERGPRAQIVTGPSGRPTVQITGADLKYVAASCPQNELEQQTATEQPLIDALTTATGKCLGLADAEGAVHISVAFQVQVSAGSTHATPDDIDDCLVKNRRAQLKPYVAPAALLFVTSNDTAPADLTFNLSRPNVLRIAGVTGLILLIAIAATVLVGGRLVRPLRALAEAARNPADDQQRVPVTTRDEIGNLAQAFNELTDRRTQLETQRKALISDVAHELRSPLTNIRNWLEGAQDGVVDLDPQVLDLVLQEAVLLQHVIDDLRDLAAADAGTLRLHPEPSYVNDLLAQVVEAHRETAKTVGVRLISEPDGDPEVTVDPHRLRQLVGNLIANAVRHTPADGVVTLHSVVTDGWLHITVADTGTGIAPDDLPRIFERFWRADASRSRQTGGSGLGLSIVQRLTEAHGGTVTAASRLGEGSVFTVRLPATP
jgi:two-component system sensor histidine kinase BaeS